MQTTITDLETLKYIKNYIEKAKPRSPSLPEIATYFKISPTGAKKRIDRLVRQKMVKRKEGLIEL